MLEYKDGPQSRTVAITPEIAREWLENTRINRSRRGDRVTAYARDMRNGQWRPVGDPIRRDRLGNLIDGQHRLAAIVDSGCTIPMIVVDNLEPDDQLVLDSGAPRRAADYLHLAGTRNAVRVASVARGLFMLDQDRLYDGSLRATNQEIFETMNRYPGLLDSVNAVEGLGRQIGISPLNAGLAHVIGSEKIPVTTYQFFEKLKTGAHMAATDPALLLRNRLTSAYEIGTRIQQFYLILHALILTKDDVQTYTKLQLPRDSKVTQETIAVKVAKLRRYPDERLAS